MSENQSTFMQKLRSDILELMGQKSSWVIDRLNITLIQSHKLRPESQQEFEHAIAELLDEQSIYLDQNGWVSLTQWPPNINVFFVLMVAVKRNRPTVWSSFYAAVSLIEESNKLLKLLIAELDTVADEYKTFYGTTPVCGLKQAHSGLTAIIKSYLFLFRAFIDRFMFLLHEMSFVLCDPPIGGQLPEKIQGLYDGIKKARFPTLDADLRMQIESHLDLIVQLRYIRNNLKLGAVMGYTMNWDGQKLSVAANISTRHRKDNLIDDLIKCGTLASNEAFGLAMPVTVLHSIQVCHQLLEKLVIAMEKRFVFESDEDRQRTREAALTEASSFWFNIR